MARCSSVSTRRRFLEPMPQMRADFSMLECAWVDAKVALALDVADDAASRLEEHLTAHQAKLTDAGRVTAEMHWERIEYLLERIIPVAEEFKVRMGNSQEDPPTPPGYRGVDKVLNDFEGMKRFSVNAEGECSKST